MSLTSDLMSLLDGGTGRFEALATKTGSDGYMRAEDLPQGWVSVQPDGQSDWWHGPVIHEGENGIQIEVWGSTLTYAKSHCAIVRATA